MAKKSFGIIGAVNRLLKKIYVVVGGVYRKVSKIYVVVDGVYRLAWKNGTNFILVGGTTGQLTVANEDSNYATVTSLLTSGSSTTEQVYLLKKLNGEIILSRGQYGFYKYNPATNSLATLSRPAVGYAMGVRDMAYGNGYYYGIAYMDTDDTQEYRTFYGSTFGSWSFQYISSKGFRSLQFHNGAFYMYAPNDRRLYRLTGTPPTTAVVSTAVHADSQSYRGYTVFKGKIILYAGTESSDYIYYCDESSDMSAFTRISTTIAPVCLITASDRVIGINPETKKVCYSMDGLTWTSVDALSNVRAVHYEDGVYYASAGSDVYSSNDVITWTLISTGHSVVPFVSYNTHFLVTKMDV